MREKRKWKTVLVDVGVHKRLTEDKEHFQKKIGGGKWSINDTINEYITILNTVRDKKQ